MPDAARAYAVYDLTQAHPKNLYMRSWASNVGDYVNYLTPVTLDDLVKPGSQCTACFGGWVAVHAGFEVDSSGRCLSGDKYSTVFRVAQQLLDIDNRTAVKLFHRTAAGGLAPTIREIFGERPDHPYSPDSAAPSLAALPWRPRHTGEDSMQVAMAQVVEQYLGFLDLPPIGDLVVSA